MSSLLTAALLVSFTFIFLAEVNICAIRSLFCLQEALHPSLACL
jgi:hypothetical protein